MSVGRSRLAAVLRLRAMAERRTRGQLAHAEREQRRAEEMLARRREAPLPESPEGLLSPLQLRALALQGVRSHELLLHAAAEVERSREVRGQAHREWSEASRELKSTERLDERRTQQAVDHARTAAERALDELVLLRRGWQR